MLEDSSAADTEEAAAAEERALSIGAMTLDASLTETNALSMGAMMLSIGTVVGWADKKLSRGAIRLEASLIEATERMLWIGARTLDASTAGVEEADTSPCVGRPAPLGSIDDVVRVLSAKRLDKIL